MPYYIKRKPKSASQEKKKATKSTTKKKPNLVAKLDKYFSLYIRLRDTMPNGYCRCISCGRIKLFSDMDCGHFFSRRHMATRFYEDNAHAECAGCNRFGADHLIGYQQNLIKKIGQNRYDKLNVMAHSVKHWTDYELEQMIKYYKEKAQVLSSEKGIKISV